jgi:hypothetical protein
MQVQYKTAAAATAAAASAARGAVQKEQQQLEQHKQQQQKQQQKHNLQHLQLQALMQLPTMAPSLSSESASPSLLSPSASSPSSAPSLSTARTGVGAPAPLSEQGEHQLEEDLQHLQLQALMRLRTAAAAGGPPVSQHLEDIGDQPREQQGAAGSVPARAEISQVSEGELGSHKRHLQYRQEQLQRYQEILRASLGGAVTQHSPKQEEGETPQQQLEQDGSLLDLLQQLEEVNEEVSLEYCLEQQEQDRVQNQHLERQDISEEQRLEEVLQQQGDLEQPIRQEEDAELQRYLQELRQQWPDVKGGQQHLQHQQQQQQLGNEQQKELVEGKQGQHIAAEQEQSHVQQILLMSHKLEEGEEHERQSRLACSQQEQLQEQRQGARMVVSMEHQQSPADKLAQALLAKVDALEKSAAEMIEELGTETGVQAVTDYAGTTDMARDMGLSTPVQLQAGRQQSVGAAVISMAAAAAATTSGVAYDDFDDAILDDDEFDEALFENFEIGDLEDAEDEVDPQVAAEVFALQQHMLQLQQQLQQAGKQLCSTMGRGPASPSFAAAGREAAAGMAAAAAAAATVAEQHEQQLRRISMIGRRSRGSMAGRAEYSRSSSSAGLLISKSSATTSGAAVMGAGGTMCSSSSSCSPGVDEAAEAAEAALASALAALGAPPPAGLMHRRRNFSTSTPGAIGAGSNAAPANAMFAAAGVGRRRSTPQLPPRHVASSTARGVKGSTPNQATGDDVSSATGRVVDIRHGGQIESLDARQPLHVEGEKKGPHQNENEQESGIDEEEALPQQNGGPLHMQSLMAALRHVRLALTNSPAVPATASPQREQQQQQQQGPEAEEQGCQKEGKHIIGTVGDPVTAAGGDAGGGGEGLTRQHVVTALQQLALALQDNTTLAWEVAHLQELMVHERVRGW